MHLKWRVVAMLGWSVDTAPIWFDGVVDDVLWEQEIGIWSRQSGACCCCSCSRMTAASARPGRVASTWWAGEVVRRHTRVLRPLPLPQRTERRSEWECWLRNSEHPRSGRGTGFVLLGALHKGLSPRVVNQISSWKYQSTSPTDDKLVGGHLAGSVNILYMYNTSSVFLG